jgi:hypothetical protein
MEKVCYIINFYFGKRRKTIDRYSNIDRLCFVRKQIEILTEFKHNLSKIIFNFNLEPEHYSYFNEALKIIPQQIQNSEVEINIRENKGMSYGAWSDLFGKNRDKFNYFIFNEDDYFFIEDNFDSTLVRKFNSYPNCGYLCMIVRPSESWNNYQSHAGHSSGISSNKILSEIYLKYGELPHGISSEYEENEINGQVKQSYAFVKEGYKLYDIRDEYRVLFIPGGIDDKNDYHIYFDYNEKELIKSAKSIFYPGAYSFWSPFGDGRYNIDFLVKLYA